MDNRTLRDRRTLKPLELDTLTVGLAVYAPSDTKGGGYRPATITDINNGDNQFTVTYVFTEQNPKRVWEQVSGPKTITNDGL